MVFDTDYLHQLIKQYNGKLPCFITHNSFRLNEFGFPKDIKVSKIFIDLDNKAKPENALLDARKVARFAIEQNHPVAFAFSAGKGFHIYPLMEPEYYQVGAGLKEAIRAAQMYFVGLGQWNTKYEEYTPALRTYDDKVIGDERRLCRVWMTKYVSGHQVNGEYLKLPYHCCPLTSEMILNMTFEEIQEYAKAPQPVNFDWAGYEPLTLRQFIKKFDIKKPASYHNKPEGGQDGAIAAFTGAADEFVMSLFPDRPCIAEGICQENPVHEARFAACAYLRHRLGMSKAQIYSLFASRRWLDIKQGGKTKYQINQIFRIGYNTPTCNWLRQYNLCLGIEKCEELKSKLMPDYKKYDSEEWE